MLYKFGRANAFSSRNEKKKKCKLLVLLNLKKNKSIEKRDSSPPLFPRVSIYGVCVKKNGRIFAQFLPTRFKEKEKNEKTKLRHQRNT